MLSDTGGVSEPLFYVLLIAAVLARLLTTELEQNLGVSPGRNPLLTTVDVHKDS